MVSLFIEHIRKKNLLDPESTYLLGLSGGIDSVALAYLLKSASFNFEIAHVNYGLRGSESDGDESFVKKLAESWGLPFHLKKVDDTSFEKSSTSVQMTARDIRYSWFEELVQERNLQGILVAHHFEDQIETVFLNLLRGTGIEGTYGMSERRGRIIRPLLPFHRSEILDFMTSNGYQWREDSSNLKSDYKRNYLRNEVFPLIEARFPEGMDSLDKSFKRLKDTGKAFFHLYGDWRDQHILHQEGYQILEFKHLSYLPGKHSLLFYWLRDYGFGFSEVEDILETAENGHSGKVFYSREFMLNVDRERLILGKLEIDWEPVSIEKNDIRVELNAGRFDILYLNGDVEIDRNAENAMLDRDKLSFPLTVRRWELGDKIVPLGMKSEKKISDLLIDLKVPLIEKRKVAVLLSGNEVAWVLGYRISEKFKCDSTTKNILYFKKIHS
ncbi:tRNA lysidine(34) synthetase TilS [Cecembia calidifontis]|jgi:tRNA(Ile)-lysidine synthase|uniref:tRNA(Ile)-lysidine synthase n=1 Tax=Cecembia calidifontis TaxID=1187080 RepID=A0A4Q7PEA2_9BACT|nr:tRNA lysidine(34) synthetase TilS [Cecembia calidifontis]RZS98734.1 tRNA(Ile)-lysidine synthase [Cecembia calidifontis]